MRPLEDQNSAFQKKGVEVRLFAPHEFAVFLGLRRCAMRVMLEEKRRFLADLGEDEGPHYDDWLPAKLTHGDDPWCIEENGVLYKAARGRSPSETLVVYFRG